MRFLLTMLCASVIALVSASLSTGALAQDVKKSGDALPWLKDKDKEKQKQTTTADKKNTTPVTTQKKPTTTATTQKKPTTTAGTTAPTTQKKPTGTTTTAAKQPPAANTTTTPSAQKKPNTSTQVAQTPPAQTTQPPVTQAEMSPSPETGPVRRFFRRIFNGGDTGGSTERPRGRDIVVQGGDN